MILIVLEASEIEVGSCLVCFVVCQRLAWMIHVWWWASFGSHPILSFGLLVAMQDLAFLWWMSYQTSFKHNYISTSNHPVRKKTHATCIQEFCLPKRITFYFLSCGQGFACLQGGLCISSMGRPVSYESAVAWKVVNDEDEAHCICFMFVNWSFV